MPPRALLRTVSTVALAYLWALAVLLASVGQGASAAQFGPGAVGTPICLSLDLGDGNHRPDGSAPQRHAHEDLCCASACCGVALAAPVRPFVPLARTPLLLSERAAPDHAPAAGQRRVVQQARAPPRSLV